MICGRLQSVFVSPRQRVVLVSSLTYTNYIQSFYLFFFKESQYSKRDYRVEFNRKTTITRQSWISKILSSRVTVCEIELLRNGLTDAHEILCRPGTLLELDNRIIFYFSYIFINTLEKQRLLGRLVYVSIIDNSINFCALRHVWVPHTVTFYTNTAFICVSQ